MEHTVNENQKMTNELRLQAFSTILPRSQLSDSMCQKTRCPWAGDLPIYVAYHDNEWGCPVHDDNKLFEMLILEGMQAGLSWITVLKKREAFREAFDGFDPHKVALYDDAKVEALLSNEKIIRNRLKILAAVQNAKAFLEIVREFGSFDAFIWRYVNGKPIVGHWGNMQDVPASTPLSDTISKDLKRRGFKFVGSTIVYSFMQAVGIVNDHIKSCFVYGDGCKDRATMKRRQRESISALNTCLTAE